MNKKSTLLALAVAVFLAAHASRGHAAIDYGTWFDSGINVPYSGHSIAPHQITLNWTADTYGHTGGGGEFRVHSVYNPAGGLATITYLDSEKTARVFKTFCLEQNEHIYLGTAYDLSVDEAAYYGINVALDPNSNLTPTLLDDYKDILNTSTKILYGSYFDGTLDNPTKVVGFSYNSNASADALQQAIWAIEDNISPGSLTGLALALYNYGVGHVGTLANPDPIGDYYKTRVAVMNLWSPSDETSPDSPAKAAQSQLMWYGDPSQSQNPVPEPTSLALWAIGLASASAYRRRRNHPA